MISLEPEPESEPMMPSADDEAFAAWVSGLFSSTAAVAEEASTFNTTGVMSHGQEDAQAQEHKKRRLDAVADADAVTNEEFAAWVSGFFSSTAAVAEEASTFNTTGVMSHGQEDAQAQEHKKRRLDADT